MKDKSLPLSPHLQVYRLPLTAIMSISHRLSGGVLAIGTLMVVWMLLAAATGMDAYNTYLNFASGWIGKTMIVGWSAALCYHLVNGIRHMLWDIGFLFELKNAQRANIVVIIGAITLFAALWGCLYTG